MSFFFFIYLWYYSCELLYPKKKKQCHSSFLFISPICSSWKVHGFRSILQYYIKKEEEEEVFR